MLIAFFLTSWATEPVPTDPSPASETTAEEPPPPKTEPTSTDVFQLPTVGPLPSALQERKPELDEENAALVEMLKAAGFDEEDFEQPKLLRSSWYFRPTTAIAQLVGDEEGGPVALRLGVDFGHRWSTHAILPVQAMAQAGVRASAPMFGARGRRLEGYANVGPWLGPVRLQVGLNARWEQERWRRRTLLLDDSVLVGGEVMAALDTGPLLLSAAVQPLFQVAGERARPDDAVLPVLGHETLYTFGAGLQGKRLGVRAHTSWRDTVIGSLLEIGMSLNVRLGGS